MNKFFKKSKKHNLVAILGTFCPNLGKNGFSWKKGLCQFLDIPIIYHRTKNQRKLLSHFWEKRQTDGWTDRKIDNSDFIGPPQDGDSTNINVQNPAQLKNKCEHTILVCLLEKIRMFLSSRLVWRKMEKISLQWNFIISTKPIKHRMWKQFRWHLRDIQIRRRLQVICTKQDT